jgi:hypothetical protein
MGTPDLASEYKILVRMCATKPEVWRWWHCWEDNASRLGRKVHAVFTLPVGPTIAARAMYTYNQIVQYTQTLNVDLTDIKTK